MAALAPVAPQAVPAAPPRPRKLPRRMADVLAAIARHPGLSSGAIARMTQRTTPAVTLAVDALEQSGLVARRQHTRDRRLVVLTATEAGHAWLAATQAEG
jgi:DNA-binding MarR family transcriptional regulator